MDSEHNKQGVSFKNGKEACPSTNDVMKEGLRITSGKEAKKCFLHKKANKKECNEEKVHRTKKQDEWLYPLLLPHIFKEYTESPSRQNCQGKTRQEKIFYRIVYSIYPGKGSKPIREQVIFSKGHEEGKENNQHHKEREPVP